MKKSLLKGLLLTLVVSCQVLVFSVGTFASEDIDADVPAQEEVIVEDEADEDEDQAPVVAKPNCIGLPMWISY